VAPHGPRQSVRLGVELGEGALARIGEQVAVRQGALAQAGFEPGSPLALRAFN